MKNVLILAGTALALAACAPEPESFPALGQNADACGAAGYTTLLGKSKDDVAAMSFPTTVRLIGPGMAVTMEFQAQRLNLLYDERGLITRVYCG